MISKQLKDKDGQPIEPKAPSKVGYLNASNPQTLVKDREYTATSNGWIIGSVTVPVGKFGSIRLIVSSKVVMWNDQVSHDSVISFPVKNGQQYQVSWWGEGITGGGTFYPE